MSILFKPRLLSLALTMATLPIACTQADSNCPQCTVSTETPPIEFKSASVTAKFEDVVQECVESIKPTAIEQHSGLGDDNYPLVTLGKETDLVKKFYSQGFTLQYSFNFPDAIRAFHKAIELDPGAAMPYWGIALSANSNINSTATNGCARLSYFASQMALKNATQRQNEPIAQQQYNRFQLDREIAYANAFATLFEKRVDTVVINDKTHKNYADAMKTLSEKYQDDLDAATLYADALLNITPWKWWSGSTSNAGQRPVPTKEASLGLEVLKQVLQHNPQHSGANHFYIHAIEESPESSKGTLMAGRLPKLTPGAGHMVHMASHIHQRIGDNATASTDNYNAIAVDQALALQSKIKDVYPLHYLGHNIHFLAWTLSIQGRRSETLNTVRELIGNTRSYAKNPYLCQQFSEEIHTKADYFFATAYYFGVRFQAWDFIDEMSNTISDATQEINATCEQSSKQSSSNWKQLSTPYTQVMQAYAKAYQALGQNADLNKLREFWTFANTALKNNAKLQYGNNKAINLFHIANIILLNKVLDHQSITWSTLQEKLKSYQGTFTKTIDYEVDNPETLAYCLKNNPIIQTTSNDIAPSLWCKAVKFQDELNYNEPPDWYYTLRESLGYALLDKAPGAAEEVFQDDLKENKNSGRSLNGLILSLNKQGKTVPPALKEQLSMAWRNATVNAMP
jgi:hypothetical protein